MLATSNNDAVAFSVSLHFRGLMVIRLSTVTANCRFENTSRSIRDQQCHVKEYLLSGTHVTLGTKKQVSALETTGKLLEKNSVSDCESLRQRGYSYLRDGGSHDNPESRDATAEP